MIDVPGDAKGEYEEWRTMLKSFLHLHLCHSVLLQHGADPNIRNTDGKSALDLADPSAKAVLTGQSLLAAYLSHLHFRHLTHMYTK